MSRARTPFADSVRHPFCLRCRFPQVALLACFAAMAGIAGHVRAEDDILKLVPEQALGFVVLNRPAAADAKLQELGQQLKLPIPSLFTMLEGPGGIRKGLDKNRPVAVLALPSKDDKSPPTMIGLIPVSDYASFLEQFKSEDTVAGVTKIQVSGVPTAVRNVGRYAAITLFDFRETLEKDVKLADEVPAALAPWRTWLAEKDAAAVVLAPGIRALSAKVQQGIAAIKPLMAQTGGQAKQAAAALDMYVMLFQAAEKEVASFGVGIERDAQGVIRLSKRARLVPGGDWAGFIAGAKPPRNVLAGLPDGPFVFAGGGPLSEATMSKMMDLSFGLIKNMREMYGLSEEQAKTFSELAKEKFPAVRGFSFLLGTGKNDEPILSQMLGIMWVKNSETFMADYEKYLARYSRIVEKIDSPMFQPAQVEKSELDGIHGLKVTMSVPQMPNMPPQSAKMMERMYGPGGKITIWVVPCSEHAVVMSYGGQSSLRQAMAVIKEGKPGLAANEELAKVAALLPSGTTWVAYLSPKGIVDFVNRTIAAALPPGIGVKVPEFGATPPLAIAVTTGPDEVEVHVIVPAEVVKAIGGLVGAKAPKTPMPTPEE